jgi:hypothetical protein
MKGFRFTGPLPGKDPEPPNRQREEIPSPSGASAPRRERTAPASAALPAASSPVAAISFTGNGLVGGAPADPAPWGSSRCPPMPQRSLPQPEIAPFFQPAPGSTERLQSPETQANAGNLRTVTKMVCTHPRSFAHFIPTRRCDLLTRQWVRPRNSCRCGGVGNREPGARRRDDRPIGGDLARSGWHPEPMVASVNKNANRRHPKGAPLDGMSPGGNDNNLWVAGFGRRLRSGDPPTTPHEISSMLRAICGWKPSQTRSSARRLPSSFGEVFGGDPSQRRRNPDPVLPRTTSASQRTAAKPLPWRELRVAGGRLQEGGCA